MPLSPDPSLHGPASILLVPPPPVAQRQQEEKHVHFERQPSMDFEEHMVELPITSKKHKKRSSLLGALFGRHKRPNSHHSLRNILALSPGRDQAVRSESIPWMTSARGRGVDYEEPTIEIPRTDEDCLYGSDATERLLILVPHQFERMHLHY